MKKKLVFVTLAIFLAMCVFVILVDVYAYENLQFWKGGFICSSVWISLIFSFKDEGGFVKQTDILHIMSGFMLGASIVLFIGMCLNIV